MRDLFQRFAYQSSRALGDSNAFLLATAGVVLWGALGPALHYSDEWQLMINTTTNIVTFLCVFLIQNSQNRESHAMQLKLDELLRSIKEARNELIKLENLSEEELEKLDAEFRRFRERPPQEERLPASI